MTPDLLEASSAVTEPAKEPRKVAHVYDLGTAVPGELSRALCGALGVPFGIPVELGRLPPAWVPCARCVDINRNRHSARV